MSKRQPKTIKSRPKKEAEIGGELWEVLEIGRLGRDRHVRSCLLCKALIAGCAASGEDDYMEQAVEAIVKHREEHKSDENPKGTGCDYDGCVLHEELPRDLALEMIRLGGGDTLERDLRGVQVSCIPFLVREKDHPEGFDMAKQDVVHRAFPALPPAAAEIYVRLGPKKTMLHLCLTPAYVSRHENLEDAPTIEDIVKIHEGAIPKIKEWSLHKYAGLKKLAEFECADEKQKEENKP